MRDASNSNLFRAPDPPPKRSLSAAHLAALQKGREARLRAKQARIEAAKKCAQGKNARENAREELLASSSDSIVFDPWVSPQFSEDEVKEVHQIVNNFIKTTPGYVIYQIDKIINPILEQSYEAARTQFQNSGLPVDEELQYHGTKIQNIKK